MILTFLIVSGFGITLDTSRRHNKANVLKPFLYLSALDVKWYVTPDSFDFCIC